VAIDSDNNVYLSGWTKADLFGINNGTGNMFIVKFDGEKGQKISGYEGPKQGDIITNSIGMKLVYIPAGDFMMGCNDGNSNEKPVHKVTISKDFYMGVTEVTQAQYKALMGTNPSYFKGDNNPVERVNRDDAMEFCRKLSQSDGKIYTLPTEAQWEYACRAGTTTKYSFGNSESELYKFGNYCDKSNTTGYSWQDKRHDDGYDKTAAVGSYRPNNFGLYDMHGNVWEWCRDWFDESYYSKAGKVDPENTQNTGFHLLRGGNWRNWASICRSATRFRLTPGYRSNSVGLRVVIEVE
jgi:formylglycine-generating enzyme required for sulfatase activity